MHQNPHFHQNPLKINKNPKINLPSTITIPESDAFDGAGHQRFLWTLQNIWYLLCGSHIGPPRREWDHSLRLCCFPGAYLFRFPVTFADWGVKLVPKLECSFVPHELQVASLLDKAPTSGHMGALEKSRVQKLMANGSSGNSKTVYNRGFWEEHLIDPEDVFPCMPMHCYPLRMHRRC